MLNKTFTGLIEVERTPAEVEQDFLAEEILDMSSRVEWVAKKDSELKKYPIWSQNGSSACVAFSYAKAIGVEIYRKTGVWVDLSAAYFYQQRVNQFGEGMFTSDALRIASQLGTTLEALMPSQQLTEAEINAVPTSDFAESIARSVAEAVGSFLYLPNDMDAIARVLDTGKSVPVSVFAGSGEYRGKKVPKVLDANLTRSQANFRHKLVITDYYLDKKYGKVFLVEDSWGVHNADGGRRLFTEEWFYARCSMATYFNEFEFDAVTETKPNYRFNTNLSRATKAGVLDVIMLQDCLKHLGHFPSNVDSTGYYGAITERAVKAFQAANSIEQVGVVGPLTRAKLNSIFN